ncbi:MAG TPA: helix-hairpin-helix domain-containing protein [Candidatus Mediterraneibacter excrementavium]|nr:helix-hairpin-helix domain-containing protein [Candidatus Mediterraneibacter excrementavium]
MKMLVIMAFLFLSGCGEKAEEHGLEELSVSGETGGAEDGSDAGTASGSVDTSDAGTASGSGDTSDAEICVYICGAVHEPGVYELPEGSRVHEALEMAGGMTEEAAAYALNLARIAVDGEQIYVPDAEEIQGQSILSGSGYEKKVNINTASMEELMTLTGIGEAKAESIIRYREENGGFQSIEDLMEIGGIKEGVFEKIKDDITI